MRENKIERSLKEVTESLGGIAYKFISPNRVGVPDRLVLLPIPKRYRKLISKYIFFVECKAPGKKPRTTQLTEHRKIEKLGIRVKVLDTLHSEETCDLHQKNTRSK